jgi:hypothetical protein
MVCGGNWDTRSALLFVGFGKSLVIGVELWIVLSMKMAGFYKN